MMFLVPWIQPLMAQLWRSENQLQMTVHVQIMESQIAMRVKQRRRPVTHTEVQQATTTFDSSEPIRHV